MNIMATIKNKAGKHRSATLVNHTEPMSSELVANHSESLATELLGPLARSWASDSDSIAVLNVSGCDMTTACDWPTNNIATSTADRITNTNAPPNRDGQPEATVRNRDTGCRDDRHDNSQQEQNYKQRTYS